MSMMISTKGRYALRVMLDLAEQPRGQYVPLLEIAERQGISEKYLEGIVATLSRGGFVRAVRGKGGGYQLSKSPEEYTVGSILKAIEGSLAPVACLNTPTPDCNRADQCRTLPMWRDLHKLVDDFFEGITLAGLLAEDAADMYSI